MSVFRARLAADALPKVATKSSGSELLDLRFLCLEEEHKLMHQWRPFQLQF